jgi:hypothetical protein
MLVVPKVLSHRQGSVPHPKAAARRLVHLAEDHHHVWQHSRFPHFAVQLLAFATAFADAAEEADALVLPDHVVDHLGEEHGLADAGATEEPGLATPLEGHKRIDDFDASLEYFGLGGSAPQRRWSSMHGTPLDLVQRRSTVNDVAEHVEHPAEHTLADRSLQRAARIHDAHAAGEALCGCQRDAAHVARVALRQHFDRDAPVVAGAQQGMDRR